MLAVATPQAGFAQAEVAGTGDGRVPECWNGDYFIGSWDVEPGMKGVAKTVIFGTRIDEFEITVIQVARGRGFDNRPMLLCRAEGWVMDFTGGIAGGMSGSPVYFDGKLGGAVSGHWSNTDQKTCIVTPIDQMLFAFEHDDERFEPFALAPPGTAFDATPYIYDFAYPHGGDTLPATAAPEAAGKPGERDSDADYFDLNSPVEIGGERYTSIAMARSHAESPASKPGVLAMSMCAAPVSVSGATPELAAMFAGSLASDIALDVSVVLPLESGDLFAVPDSEINAMRGIVPDKILEEIRYAPNITASAILEPGCVLGVRTVRGDLSSFGYGTLTYVDANGNFLAYGHRSGRRGAAALPVSNGFVYYVPANWQRVGKNAVCLETVGLMYQDRGAAIAGTFGHKPGWIPVTVCARDQDNLESTVIRCEAADTVDALPQAASGIVSAGLGYAAARSAEGTVTAVFTVNLKDAGTFSWRSVYLADAALGAGGAEVRAFLDAAMFGEGEQVQIESVSAVAETAQERRSFRIAEVRSLAKPEFDKLEIPKSGRFLAPAGDDFDTAFPGVKSEKIKEDKLVLAHDRIGRVHLMLRLVPFKSDVCVWMPVTVTVPVEMFGKPARIQVFGGGGLSNAAESGQTAFDAERSAQRRHISWKRSADEKAKLDWLREFTLSPRGQHLIVEFAYAGKPADIGLTDNDDLPRARRQIEMDAVFSGYTGAEALFK